MDQFVKCLFGLAANMTISSIYALKHTLFEINRICMITFVVLLGIRIIQSKGITMHNIGIACLVAVLKAVHFASSLYNLITFSFIISDLVEQLSRRSVLKSIAIVGVLIMGTNCNLIELCVVVLIERVSKFLVNKLQQSHKESKLSDIIAYVIAIVVTLCIAVYEIVLQQLQDEITLEYSLQEYTIQMMFMICLFLISINRITQVVNKLNMVRYRFQGVVACILFGIYQVTLSGDNYFNLYIIWPALILFMLYDIFSNTSTDLLPTTTSQSPAGWNAFMAHVNSNRDARNLLIQLCMNFSFMFVELIYGVISNSLGLITDSLHMLIDSSALAIALYASFMSKQKPNGTFTFGYERVEILSGYANGIFLLFAVVEIMSESFERLVTPQKVLPGKMMVVSILGLIVNLIGLYFFHNHGHIHSEDVDEQLDEQHQHHCSHHHDHNHNLSGVYLHILADALGSVACIISAITIYYYEFYLADPITSMVISLLILATTIRLLKDTSRILLLQLPYSGRKILHQIKQDLSSLNIQYKDLIVWQYKEKKLVLTGKFYTAEHDEISNQTKIEDIISKYPHVAFKAIDFEYVDAI